VEQMLTQLRHQFDIIDSTSNFSAYRVLILPDSHRLDDTLQRKLSDYLAGGGKLILSNESGLDSEGGQFVLPIGVAYESPWKHDDQYIEVIDAQGNHLEEMVQIAYETGTAVRTAPGGTSLARSWKSYFDKDYEHFQVEQIPPEQATEYSAAVATSNTVYFATPIFRTYARFGYSFYRDLVGSSLRRLLAEPLVIAEGPTTMQATVTEQPKRRIVHLLNYIPERRAPNLDIVEDVIPLSNVKLRLRMDQIPQKVYLAPQRKAVDFSYANGYVVTVVPTLTGHQMIVFEHA
jgi:beta-galactosidase GanA